jgi:hypothetical protein
VFHVSASERKRKNWDMDKPLPVVDQKKRGAEILKKLVELYPQKKKEDLAEVIKKNNFDETRAANFLLQNPTYTTFVPIETTQITSNNNKDFVESKYYKASKRV